jgi:hypothetical protein
MEDLILYVSTAGSDIDGEGTIRKPFASLEKAMDFSRVHPSRTSTSIYVREGKYFFSKPLELDESDSNMLFCAYHEERVELSGSMIFQDLSWDDCSANPAVKTAYVGRGLAFDGLFVNGVPQIMARYPNLSDGVVPLGGVADESTIKERSLNWANPETGVIRALHEHGWGGNDYRITGKNPDSPCGLDLRWIGDNNRGSHYMKNAMVAENILEELDAEKEWFYDSETGMLYFYPGNAIDIQDKSVVFEAAACSEIFRIKGDSSSNPIRNIKLSGLKFKNTKRTMFTIDEPVKQYIPLLRGDWAVVRSGVVYAENAEKMEISRCSFADIGGNAVFLHGYNKGHVIDDNEMIHIGASAIQVVGSSNAVDDPSFWEHELYPEHQIHAASIRNPSHMGPASDDYPRDITISNNHIFHVGMFEKQSTGVNLSVCSRINILHNTIHKSARSDINVNDGSFGGHEIAYNDIFDSQIETTDHGPFNSWGRDRFWSVPEYNASGEFGEFIRNYTNDQIRCLNVLKRIITK